MDHGKFTNGPMQDGTYNISGMDRKGAVMHVGEKDDGAYGSAGIIHVDSAKGASGTLMVGAGVHSGRKGPESLTLGCVRTCTDAVKMMNRVAKTDPLKTLTVKNNQANVAAWQAAAAARKIAQQKAAEAPKKKRDQEESKSR